MAKTKYDFNKNAQAEIYDNGGTIYIVGGALRDDIIGISDIKDKDYVITGIDMESLISILSKHGNTDFVGKSFGVIKFTSFNETVDIALPRLEKSTGDNHTDFTVHYDHNMPIEKDLGRRDFSINAMAFDIKTDTLIDPYDGMEMIQNKTIRHIYDGAFVEDPLRMMRAMQFASRLKFKISADTARSITKNKELINSVSGERILCEIEKILTKSEFPSIAFNAMKDTGLLEYVIPPLHKTIGVSQPLKFHNLDVYGHITHAIDSAMSTKLHVRMAALFHDVGKPVTYTNENGEVHFFGHENVGSTMASNILRKWHASDKLIHDVTTLIKNHMFDITFETSDRSARRLINRVGEELIYDLIDLRIGDRLASGKPFLSMGKIARFRDMVDSELAEPAFSLQHLCVDGNDLIEMGLKPGPMFRTILHDMLELVLDDKKLNDKETLKTLIIEKYKVIQ